MSKQTNKQTNKKEAKRNEVVASLDLLSGAISPRKHAILAEARTFHSNPLICPVAHNELAPADCVQDATFPPYPTTN